jgi:hypothetical protein
MITVCTGFCEEERGTIQQPRLVCGIDEPSPGYSVFNLIGQLKGGPDVIGCEFRVIGEHAALSDTASKSAENIPNRPR